MILFDNLSKNAQQAVHRNRACRAFARRNGRSGWKLQFVSKKMELPLRFFDLQQEGYEEIKRPAHHPSNE